MFSLISIKHISANYVNARLQNVHDFRKVDFPKNFKFLLKKITIPKFYEKAN